MKDYVYAIIGIPLIFVCTTLGATLVFFLRKKQVSQRLNRILIGFAAGVMLSASFFGLLKPAIETPVDYMPSWAIVVISVLLGAAFLWGIDKLVPHLHAQENKEEGLPAKRLSKTGKMFLAVTIHNVPEGLTVGVAFGVALAAGDHALMISAFLLAAGIGLQNIPEGAAVSLPIQSETGSTGKAFVFGMLSGIVEPIAAVVGLFLAMEIQALMPWALAFAGGCMIYVIAEEMMPDMKGEVHDHFGIWSFIIGFVAMMTLDCIQF